MEIHFTLKQTYGKARAVPLCPNALTFADIAGTSTLTLRTLQNVEALGYRLIYCININHVPAPRVQTTSDQLKEAGVE
jgi:hypothetical protein